VWQRVAARREESALSGGSGSDAPFYRICGETRRYAAQGRPWVTIYFANRASGRRLEGAGTIGSRATSLPRVAQTARLTCPYRSRAETDPSSSTPHKRVSRRYLRRSWSRRSSRSILGSTVEKGVRGEGADRAEDRRPGLLTLPPEQRNSVGGRASGAHLLPFLSLKAHWYVPRGCPLLEPARARSNLPAGRESRIGRLG
jgi:hypothetical protein